MSFIPLYAFKFGLTVVFCRSFHKCPWRLTRLLYCPTWAIGIARDTLILCLYPLYVPLILFQLARQRLSEMLLGDHGIVACRPDLVLKWMYIILTPCRRHCLPLWLRPSRSNLPPNSDPSAHRIWVRQGSRPFRLTLLSSSFLSMLSEPT
jgi:hypothetical protein